MLDAGPIGDEYRQPQPDRAADAVVQPHRMPVYVRARALLGRGQGTGHALGLAPQHLLEQAAPLRRGGEFDVLPDGRDGEAELLSAEARIKRGDELAHLLLERVRAGSPPCTYDGQL